MRSFRLVTDETFTPPLCLTLDVAGNTFPSHEEAFMPKVRIHRTTSTLHFAGCGIGQSIYRTVRISNDGDTPVKYGIGVGQKGVKYELSSFYDVLKLGNDVKNFTVKPRVGVLGRNQSQLVVMQFTPYEAEAYESMLLTFFNNSLTSQKV
jgi:hypothetical protein